MAGLLDFEWLKTPEGQGLLGALAGYAANAQRGAPINSIGRGGLAGLLAYSQAGDRQLRQQEQAQEREYRGLKINQLRTDVTRQQLIQDELRKLDQEQGVAARTAAVSSQLDPQPADEYGTASVGGVPLYSASGASRFGNQPIGTYTSPQPQTSMPTTPAQPGSFNVGGGQPARGELPYTGTSPGFSASGAGALSGVDPDRLIRQARVYERAGDMKTAAGLYELAQKYRPEFATDFRQVTDPRTGELINVMVAKDGTVTPVPYGVKPDIQFQEAGGHVLALDKNSTRGGMSWQKSPTHADRISAGNLAVSQQRLGMDQQRLAWDQSQPHYMELNGGIVALPKRPAPGAPLVGQSVSVPGMPGAGQPKLTEVQGNATQFGTRMLDASRVINEIESGPGGAPYPSTVARAAYDPQFPSWLPGGQVMAGAVRSINNATVPNAAQSYYQAQQNWVTANLRKESGAAIGVSEMENEIRKWFPQPGDGQDVIQRKAEARKVAEEAMLVQAGPGRDQALRLAREAAERSGGGKAGETRALPANPTPQSLEKGAVYDLPNGKRGRWNGMTFVVVGQK